MTPQEALIQAAKLIGQRKFYNHKPYGHPDTLPGGKLYEAKRASGEWEEWSGNPWQLNFHNAGKDNHERLQMAANGVGKTLSGGFEAVAHATGEYPDWWGGHRFMKANLGWVGSISNQTQREYTQPVLLGPDLAEGLGTGFIPKNKIVGRVSPRQAGISGVADEVKIKHKSGGISKIVFKTYEQGWRMWQGAAPDWVWMDEQPDDNAQNEKGIFAEAQTRVLRTKGLIFMTLTPLLGETETILHFTQPKAEGIFWINADWDDAPHLDKARKAALLASYPHHQRDARTKGIPMLGEGGVFPISEDQIVCDPFEIPAHWPQIAGVDFGFGHPFGWARLAWDRQNDTVYVTDCFGVAREIPDLHVASIKRRCPAWVPHSWPHDGLNTQGSSGKHMISSYKGQGLRFLGKQAHYKPPPGEEPKMGPQDQWIVIQALIDRMETGRFKVFKTCQPWLREYRSYHTRVGTDGKISIVALKDDVLKASFYAYMMLRYAAAPPAIRMHQAQQSALSVAV